MPADCSLVFGKTDIIPANNFNVFAGILNV